MTINDNFYDEIKSLKGITITKNASIKNDNNMKIEATFLYKIEVYTYENIIQLFKKIQDYNYPYSIIGMGSNILFIKEYYEGIIIKLMPINYKNNSIISAGSSLNFINSKLIEKGIETLNFLSGVPCSVGGAICMNAGAFNKEMKDVIEAVYYLDLKDLKIKVRNNIECQFKYRDSYFKRHECLILLTRIKLLYNKKGEIKNKHHQYLQIRNKKLPLDYPNLGSIFKNPSGNYAGKLIEDLGIKGLAYKGAMISEKHANVIINCKGSSGQDVLKLIEIIEQLVYIKYKTKLEREIIIFK